jgi:uncharacterized Zn-binding protein involved in type VI secretion
MPKGPAARAKDPVAHPLPAVLTGVGSINVRIGKQPAWRGIGALAAPPLLSAKQAADAAIDAARVATIATIGTPAFPAAKAAEETVKATTAAAMGATVLAAAGTADVHTCSTPLPLPPHGPGVVVNGSASVRINGLPACRLGDTIVEAVGPPNTIAGGEPTVRIGG